MKNLTFILIAILCLAMARHHHRTVSKSVKARAFETMQIMSRNLRIRMDLKAMGLLGIARPNESVDS
jgi:hypothetical protein